MKSYRYLPKLIDFVVGLVEIILTFRLVLKLLSANPNTPFVRWIYQSSEPILKPFNGIFPSPALEGRSLLEFSTLFALMVYAIVGFYVNELIEYTAKANGDGK